MFRRVVLYHSFPSLGLRVINNNIILVLPAFDGVGAAGIHHETARVACATCANNRWDGFFTSTRTGPRVSYEPDDLLCAEEYYFRVSDDATEIPPVSWTQAAAAIAAAPSTRRLPRQTGPTEALMARDVSCRITAHVEGTEHAHLVPRSEAAWFEENAMFRYTNPVRPDISDIDDPRNAFLLRSDVHTLFDQKRIALVPRSAPHPVFAVHVFADGSSPEIVDLACRAS
ncbi:hypothetical protein UCRNP2_4744 [Neofusicoccum parvum UCRNP2]|uniref:HNH nuclease domain-containing protein n=1 Tax=Botryosphaeria parva (strain UCR-NP2) TaxID=1287680 RepID=R1GAE8_BOTPV|nr:hypothetical protein UCRNP2_4744 [Neofusicoccum parvum UCRNP2]